MAAVGYDYTEQRMVRSKSFDSSLSPLPSIHGTSRAHLQPICRYVPHTSRGDYDVSRRRRAQPVVVVSHSALRQARSSSERQRRRGSLRDHDSERQRRRGSLKDHDLLKSMFEQLNILPNAHCKLASARHSAARMRHRSDNVTAATPHPPLLRRRASSAFNLSRSDATGGSESDNLEIASKTISSSSTKDKVQRSHEMSDDPEVKETLDKCRQWLMGLPEKFSGMHNAVSLPAITRENDPVEYACERL